MADAKKCDITGEFYEVDDNRDYDIKRYGEDIDIGPTIYNKIAKLLQPESEEDYRIGIAVEGKVSLMDLDDVEEAPAIIDESPPIKEEQPSFIAEPVYKEEPPAKPKNQLQSSYQKNLCKVANELRKDYPNLTWHEARAKAYQKIKNADKKPIIKEVTTPFVGAKTKNCDYCGKRISPNMLFCKECTDELHQGNKDL